MVYYPGQHTDGRVIKNTQAPVCRSNVIVNRHQHHSRDRGNLLQGGPDDDVKELPPPLDLPLGKLHDLRAPAKQLPEQGVFETDLVQELYLGLEGPEAIKASSKVGIREGKASTQLRCNRIATVITSRLEVHHESKLKKNSCFELML